MERFTLGRLVRGIGLQGTSRLGFGVEALLASGVSTDTRSLEPGAVFFAIRGDRFDGSRFVRQAFVRGARAAVVAQDAVIEGLGPEDIVLRVPCPTRALLDFARSYREELGFKVVAVTGSAGKTTTKDLIHTLLTGTRRTVKAPKSFNNHVGVPLTLLSADRTTEVVVVELGTNSPGEIATVAEVAQPDVAVITCIGRAHLEGLGGIEGVAREKLSILASLRPRGVAILNGDDLRLRAAASALNDVHGPGSAELVSLGAGAGLTWLARVVSRPTGPWRAMTYRGRRPGPVLELPVPGYPFATDALLALAVAVRLGVSAQDAAARLARFAPAVGRWNTEEHRGVTLIDDTYNANPTSVRASLETFAGVTAPEARTIVLGGMKELGQQSPEHHRAVGRLVARLGAGRLVCVGPEAREIATGARAAGFSPDRILEVETAAEVAPHVAQRLAPGQSVLFKASRSFALEQAVSAIRDRLAVVALAA